jgi:membrane protein YqaA with SNARE-associated domain
MQTLRRVLAAWRLWLTPLLVGLAIAVINVAVYLALPPDLLDQLGAIGYLGAFGSAWLANASIVIPIPYYLLLIRLSQGVYQYGVALAAAAGSVLGELVAYYAGRSGRQLAQRTRFYGWVQRQLQHRWRAPLVLFALSAPPNPFFDVAGLLAGAVGVPVWVFVAATFAARVVRFVAVVFLGDQLFGGW